MNFYEMVKIIEEVHLTTKCMDNTGSVRKPNYDIKTVAATLSIIINKVRT
jgi:hypothetical protein